MLCLVVIGSADRCGAAPTLSHANSRGTRGPARCQDSCASVPILPHTTGRASAAVLIGAFALARAWAQAPADAPAAQAPDGIRPAQVWSTDYPVLVLGDTEAILSSLVHWGEGEWLDAAEAVAAVGATAAFDRTIRTHVQADRTAGEDRFMRQWQEFGSYYAFGALAAFDAWGELGGNVRAKNTAMDGIAASIIAGSLITPALKVIVGRERPSTTSATFRFKPFSTNSSFPSGHATEAFAVATAIAENYPAWWVQGLAYGTACLVGYARIEQNAHFASDVVAGSLVGWSVARGVVHRNDGPPDPKRLTWTPYASSRGIGVVFFRASRKRSRALTSPEAARGRSPRPSVSIRSARSGTTGGPSRGTSCPRWPRSLRRASWSSARRRPRWVSTGGSPAARRPPRGCRP